MSEREATFYYPGEKPERLDKFLASCLPELSRSRVQTFIKEGHVLVDGEQVVKTGGKLDKPAVVKIFFPPPKPDGLIPESIPLDILFENNDVLVVNKSAGMVVHPAAGHSSGTLVHASLAHAPDIEGVGGVLRPGVVHRLDKDTSGIILISKNDFAHRWLQNQFRNHQVEKTYLALVEGSPPTPKGRIEAPIGRDLVKRKKMAIVSPEKGREAISEYSTLHAYSGYTLLEVHPITGRTHQIRVHLAFLGCPIAGDQVYGRKHQVLNLERQFLHAWRLRIQLPGETNVSTFEAELPLELQKILDQLEIQK